LPGPGGSAVGSAELAPVALDGQDAAVPAAGRISSCRAAALVNALVPPLAEVRLERVQDAWPTGGLDQRLVDAGELQHGVAGKPQAGGGLADRAALGVQRLTAP